MFIEECKAIEKIRQNRVKCFFFFFKLLKRIVNPSYLPLTKIYHANFLYSSLDIFNGSFSKIISVVTYMNSFVITYQPCITLSSKIKKKASNFESSDGIPLYNNLLCVYCVKYNCSKYGNLDTQL